MKRLAYWWLIFWSAQVQIPLMLANCIAQMWILGSTFSSQAFFVGLAIFLSALAMGIWITEAALKSIGRWR